MHCSKWWRFGAAIVTIVILLTLLVTTRAELLHVVPSMSTSKNRNHLISRTTSLMPVLSPSSSSTTKVPKEVAKQVESHLLSALGLQRVPKRQNTGPVYVPQYMLELYAQVSGEDVETIHLNLPDKRTHTANTVRNLPATEEPDVAAVTIAPTTTTMSATVQPHDGYDDMDRRRRRRRTKKLEYPRNQMRLRFDVSSVSESEKLQAAELRLYVAPSSPSPDAVSGRWVKERIAVYDIVRPATNSSPASLNLLDIRVIDSEPGAAAVVDLDVRPSVVRWLKKPDTNHGLFVVVQASSFNTPRPSLSVGDSIVAPRVRLRRSAGTPEAMWREQQPALLTYTDDGKFREDDNGLEGRPLWRSRRAAAPATGEGGGRKRKGSRYSEQCARHELYVDFADVNWDSWIVAPPGYKAYQCRGECRYPTADHLNSTNHAIVQNLVHSINLNVPPACCVPTSLAPMSMLYLDEYDKVVLKNYQDMVVTGCGCR